MTQQNKMCENCGRFEAYAHPPALPGLCVSCSVVDPKWREQAKLLWNNQIDGAIKQAEAINAEMGAGGVQLFRRLFCCDPIGSGARQFFCDYLTLADYLTRNNRLDQLPWSLQQRVQKIKAPCESRPGALDPHHGAVFVDVCEAAPPRWEPPRNPNSIEPGLALCPR